MSFASTPLTNPSETHPQGCCNLLSQTSDVCGGKKQCKSSTCPFLALGTSRMQRLAGLNPITLHLVLGLEILNFAPGLSRREHVRSQKD